MGIGSKNNVGPTKSQSLCISLIIVIICCFPKFNAAESVPGTICSVKEPTSTQVCISIKFPWTLEPVFFCTDQKNITYIPQCTDAGQSHHCHDDGRNDTLKIATLWDCCPIISTPNKCAGIVCPPAPFNRTCKVLPKTDCCPTYFCDSGEPNNCKTKRLKTSCVNPPKGKENCTAFKDPYGCCNSYQCPEDEKPGVCPRFLREGRSTDDSNQGFWKRTATVIVNGAKETVKKVVTGVKTTIEKHGGEFGKTISKSISVPFQTQTQAQSRGGRMLNANTNTNTNNLRCNGDRTCPGRMKCCQPVSVNYRLARHEIRRTTIQNGNGNTKSSNHETKVFKVQYSHHPDPSRPLDGICYEPEESSPTTGGVETTSQSPSSSPSSSSFSPSTPTLPGPAVTEKESPMTTTTTSIPTIVTTMLAAIENRENNNGPEVPPISSTPLPNIKETTTEFKAPENPTTTTTVLTEPVPDATTIRIIQASSAPLIQDPDSPENTVVQE